MDDRASHVNGTAGFESTETEASTDDPSAVDDGAGMPVGNDARVSLTPAFLAELAAAMRAAAERERGRIDTVTAEDAAAHVEKVRSRAAIETEELRRLAEDDIRAVDEWSVAEIERVRSETTQRIEDRRASLEDYLRQHETIIDAEIQGVDAAVRGYGETLDRFFEGLAVSGDPAEIVRLAETLPTPPDLDHVRSLARAGAVSMIAEAPEPETTETSDADTSDDGDSIDTGSAVEFTGSDEAVESAGEVEGTAALETSDEGADTNEVDGTDEVVAIEEGQAHPVGVMDPAIGAGAIWPATEESAADEPNAAEPVAAALMVDHTSAAVRLLRSVAPWTAPTHVAQHQPTSKQD